jgi:hypothetical protein
VRRRGRRATAGDAVGLLDQRHADPFRERGPGRGDEVGRLDASPGSVPQDESRARLLDAPQVGARETVRRFELEDRRDGY